MEGLRQLKKEIYGILSDIADGGSNESISSQYNEYSHSIIEIISSKNKKWFLRLFRYIEDELKNGISEEAMSKELKKTGIDKKLVNQIICRLFEEDTIIPDSSPTIPDKPDDKPDDKQDDITLHTDQIELINLYKHLKICNKLPKEHRQDIFNTWSIYDDYADMIDAFDRLNGNTLIELFVDIQTRLKFGISREEVMRNIRIFRPVVRFITDHLIVEPVDTDQPIGSTFSWRDNQRKAWQNSIDSDFTDGIHSQATGSGKSLVALKDMNEYHKKYY